MLKRLTRKLFTLLVLVAALAALASSPVERKAVATTPNTQAAPASRTSRTWYCERRMNDETCVWYCCSDSGCWESPC